MSDDALKMRGPVHGTKDAKRVAIGSGVGAVIETYDFIGFGTAAALYFGTPSSRAPARSLARWPRSPPSASASLARPLGGIIGGHLGDKVGRKPVLVASLIVMGLATFAIGLLPTYATVGILAPILLVTVRIIQGLAFGAEWGGAILMSYEHAPWRQKGRYTGIVQAGFPVGLLLANLVFLVSVHLGGDWAWRVPFLASIVLVIVGLIIRARVPESPVFEEVKEQGRHRQVPDRRGRQDGLAKHPARHRPSHRRDRRLRGVHHLHDLLPQGRRAGDQVRDARRAVHRGRPRHLRHHGLGATDRQDRPAARLPLGLRAWASRSASSCSCW